MTTLRPFGPSVIFTALLRISTPRRMRSRASVDRFAVDPIGRNGYPFDNVQDEAFRLDGRHGEPSLGKRESVAQGRIKGASLKIERRERIPDVGPGREK